MYNLLHKKRQSRKIKINISAIPSINIYTSKFSEYFLENYKNAFTLSWKLVLYLRKCFFEERYFYKSDSI